MAWDLELIDGPYGGTTEGPAWDGTGLLFTHIPGSRIMRYDPEAGASTVFRSNTHWANGLMFSLRHDVLYMAQSGRLPEEYRQLRAYPVGSDGSLGEHEVLEMHPVPVDRPTNCSFGDADLRTLYVTTVGGHLFRAYTERQGRLLYPPLG